MIVLYKCKSGKVHCQKNKVQQWPKETGQKRTPKDISYLKQLCILFVLMLNLELLMNYTTACEHCNHLGGHS